MNLNLTKIMFFLFLIFSTLMSISSMNWLSMWMGLELNLFSIIPIINLKSSIYTMEAAMKYFLIQSFSSIMLLMILTYKSFFFLLNLNIMIMIPLLIKLSIMPFHLWLPSMIEGLKWSTCLIMLTWQKISPMILISYLSMNKNLLMMIIMLMSMNSIFGINQNSIRKIMAMSSINNSSWMLIAILINEKLWINYFLIYSYINIMMTIFFLKYNINYINQMKIFNKNFILKLNMMMIMFSMMGLPPMLGFLMKWMLIQNLIYMKMYLILMMLILLTIINLMFYMKMCYFMLFNFNLFNKWFLKNKKTNSFYLIFWINFLSLILNYFYIF
uniref:NADH-ubiquinone oxidoreductase chain 2 n=1 Tax=Adelges tsugae TaxID=357502 RepID=A0A6M3WA06_ADETS|nr:NADH dehydrogenase subunit 2 [Adelges tsugae]